MITNLNLPAPALSYDRENEAQMRRELIRWSGSFPGAITNLALAFPAQFTVQGSPLIGPGTITVAWAVEAANLVLAGPASGAAAAPTFRALVAADLPLATGSAFGAVKPDGTTVTISGGVISSVGGASGANPTATAGPAAVNGSAATFMRSDAAPAIQKASASQFGIVEVDGTTITATAGVIFRSKRNWRARYNMVVHAAKKCVPTAAVWLASGS